MTNPPPTEMDSTLVPVLRQAIDVFKMILFKELKASLPPRFDELEEADVPRLAGAVINELFGTLSDDQDVAAFAAVLESLTEHHADLREPLTDAVRMQFLCDAEEGIDSAPILVRAEQIDLLVMDRDIPLPKTFMHLARVLGIAHGILDPQAAPES